MPSTLPGFQPNAFQLDAFQWALENNQRSGVVRLWLTKLTAELNGMSDGVDTEKEKPLEVIAPKKKTLVVSLTADGGALVGKPIKKKLSTKPEPEETQEVDVKALPLRAQALPSAQETSSYLLSKASLIGKTEIWTEEKVLALLKEAVDDDKEEEELLEIAVQLLL